MDITALKERIAANLDITELIDILDLSMYDLVEILHDHILEHKVKLEQSLWIKSVVTPTVSKI